MDRDSSSFLDRIAATIRRWRMVADGDLLLLAVSGGVDSCAMLHALHHLAPRLGVRLHVAHLNHGLRPEAESEAEFVRELGDSLGIPVTASKARVTNSGRGIEDAARRARYLFLRTAADELSADRIATAHTADDNLETLLLHLGRGCGLAGLCGIEPVSDDGRLIRPLLDVTRADAVKWCRVQGITWREDPSNRDPAFTRNRLRQALGSVLRDTFDEEVARRARRTTDLLRGDRDLLQQLTEDALQSALRPGGTECVNVDAGMLTEMHPALQRRVVRLAVARMAGGMADVESGHVEALLDVASGRIGRRYRWRDIEAELVAPGWLQLRAVYGSETPEEPPVTLAIPGRTSCPGYGCDVQAELLPVDNWDPRNHFQQPATEGFDFHRVTEPVRMRYWQSGDRFQPLGLQGTKKVGDLLTDEKTPRPDRAAVRIIASGDAIMWVVGHRIDDRFKVTEQTTTVLRLTVVDG